jgi:dTDP-L-rhamnose 4-epimerase
MSAYGEGLYLDSHGTLPRPFLRTPEQLAAGRWEMFDGLATPAGVREDHDQLYPAGFYAQTKAEQERMALLYGAAYGVEVAVVRIFNTYGPRQAIGNPYTGVCAIFGNRLLADESPLIYEDGEQTRDFTHVSDVAAAIALLLQPGQATGVFNVGTGTARSIRFVAEEMARALGKLIEPTVVGKFRSGDIRHCFADVTKLRALGWEPKVGIEDGLRDLADWLSRQPRCFVGSQEVAHEELENRGLVR